MLQHIPTSAIGPEMSFIAFLLPDSTPSRYMILFKITSCLFIDFVSFPFPLVSFNLNVTLPYFVLHDIDIFEDCMSFNLGFVDLMF